MKQQEANPHEIHLREKDLPNKPSLALLANALRFLSVDAVEKAQSGHPGMPLGMADIATVLWKDFLKHNPSNPSWFNRDRFVLSNGHGSMLLYSLLHLSGYDLSLDDLKSFRQLDSKTPGHPEYHHTPGVETTTGPLAQGLANAVGMAIAEKQMAAHFNRPGFALVDHHTYVFVGDGCLMEGLSHEVCSLAGTLELGKLIVFYDDNGISIDGPVESWFSDDTAQRFHAYHWQVIGPIDGHDPLSIQQAIQEAQSDKLRPSLIICKTIIGLGSPAQNTEKVHGAPLGPEAIAQTRRYFAWPYDAFEIPEAIRDAWSHRVEGKSIEVLWQACCETYQSQYPDLYQEFLRRCQADLPSAWDTRVKAFLQDCARQELPEATRKSSQACIEAFAPYLPELLGGSADLMHSNNTNWSETKAISAQDFTGNYLNYGVREFGMAAIMTGIALHGGFIPYGGTFLVFADYAKNAIRMSALMRQKLVYLFTHDSIGLGEDGPTHQPVEQTSMLRMTPDSEVWRPADRLETAIAWREALLSQRGPSALLLSRQSLPCFSYASTPLLNQDNLPPIERGAYILMDNTIKPSETSSAALPEAIIIATGSERYLAVEAARQLWRQGRRIRVVSMPCCERFLAQSKDYQEFVLPKQIRTRLAVEAAATAYWYRFVGLDGAVLGLDRFGLSAPAEQIFKTLGISVESIVSILNELLI